MKKSDYDLAMKHLEIIEKSFNNMAKAVGHCSFEEFVAQKATGEEVKVELKKAA